MSTASESAGAKIRHLRTLSAETREAVRFATQPPSNAIRAFAMSILSVSTGIPTARTSSTGPPASACDDLEVVDHEVEDDVHVEAPSREDAEPVGLDETDVAPPSASAAWTAGL